MQNEYDTFGFTAADAARRAAAEQAEGRGAAGLFAGVVPDELVVPVADGIGIQLLKKMGWRPGKGLQRLRDKGQALRALQQAAECLGRAVDPEAVVTLGADLPAVLPKAKSDSYGVGFDPFKVSAGRGRRRVRSCAHDPPGAGRVRGVS